MDPVLSSLLATNQIGSDGFNWWIGQVETGRESDPKGSSRYRVRIVGVHLREGQATPTEELPWANVVMPVTTPFSDGGVTGATAELRAGNWVIGFFLDNDRQKPIIMGSVGHTAGATVVKNTDPAGGSDGPRNFTTHTDADSTPQQNRSQDRANGTDPDTGANVDGGEPDAARSNLEKGAPAIIAALRAKHSETNPTGSQNCVTIANPKCGNESNLNKGITNIIGDMLAANQASGGQLGDFYVSKVNGFIYDKVSIARHHINRITRLVTSFMGRVQSEIITNLRQGIQDLVNTVLGLNVPEEQERKIPKDPKDDHRPERKKGNFLKTVKKTLDQILKALGCSIEDIIERLVSFLTDLLFNFIMDVFSPAACAIINLVDGILNKILDLVDGLINSILGPLQSILGILASPLNMIGGAISKVMSFLGISCSGPDSNCSKDTVKCNDCGTDEDESDWLDNLLNDLESGDSGERLSCEESKDYLDPKDTKVIFIGGIPANQPVPTDEPSEPPGNEGGGPPTPPGFQPIPDEPADILGCRVPEAENYNPEATIDDGSCRFAYEDYEPIDPLTFPPDDDDDDDDDPPLPIDYDGTKRFSVVGQPRLVGGGDEIVFTINTTNVADGSTLSYALVGDIVEEYIDDPLRNIDADDLLKGTFTVTQYDTFEDQFVNELDELEDIAVPLCRAEVTVKLSEDIAMSVDQDFIFQLNDEEGNDTGAFAPITILADFDVILPPTFEDPSYDPTTEVSISVTTDKQIYKEGEDIIFTIESEGFSEGRQFQYIIYGDVSADDFIGESLKGTFKLKENTAKVTIGIKDDGEIEDDEVFYFKIVDTNASCSATIERPERFIAPSEDDDTDEDPKDPGDHEKPKAFAPITGDDGSIISVTIDETGDAYTEAPRVIFSGEGFGATGIALLNDKGFVSEIRVTRGGLGYKRNLPEDSNLRCIIDSFTMIAPGIRYTSPPDVFINGLRGGAIAEIDARGYVTSVKIIDRKTSYSSTPIVKIIGGGGSGAIFKPSMVCLDTQEIETIGLVKIGTGRYIDCP